MALVFLLIALSLSLLVILATKLFFDWNRDSKIPYPPGPKPKFFLGNLLDFPKTNSARVFNEWGKRYNSVLYITGSMVFFAYK
jgi:hypothetical protein